MSSSPSSTPRIKKPLFRFFLLLSFSLLVTIAPLVAGQTRPSYHVTPATKWMNDPQRPFFREGEWHLYYLWNSDWNKSDPGSGGTEWYHVTSSDLVQWTARGVAIRKYQPNPPGGAILGDIETGSSVIDTANSAGFGPNAVVTVLTQMQDGALASGPKAVWDAVRTATNPAGGSTVKLAIYVDQSSVEAFVNDEGVTSLSGLIFPNQGAEEIEVVSGGGKLTLTSFSYATS
ncbi:hypothetical protein NCU17284 [Neurospora crassa OR74A]|uniref:Glycosyl hydrolase family 32 N-terminal domain-containing protein n=1 Tax=Neurospora crassa (strain ATCC 24698 / 74-OR23-1A / CBS 708.71 / DSM 1257 / FGSC 987) TaxID=367110 RepID=V5IMX3_NEUCR|nr:hypothetical protein NCU17284 [Neurospora crassa OR74A]ESA42081.1 hypothetical protein NCU17284 [Neurospora crassa OR74A]|eukprot:XP_011395402.1 hypothetical protein NCU17284 [Neurospora crassa OR74A]